MSSHQLHLPSTAGWRALLTHAQFAAGVNLMPAIEEHLVALLVRYVGSGADAGDVPSVEMAARQGHTGRGDAVDQGAGSMGDQCLLSAGLFPERVVNEGLSLSHFVRAGRDAYRDYATRHDSGLHGVLAQHFVAAMDVLQTLRALQAGTPCIDGVSAYALWHELGSAHGWHVLRKLTSSLPVAAPVSTSVH